MATITYWYSNNVSGSHVQLAALGLPAPFGILAVSLYLTLGAFGFPVFSNGGGISYFFEITGGYLVDSG